MESMRFSKIQWSILSHPCRREISNCWIVCESNKRLLTLPPRRSQTSSMVLMSEVYVNKSIWSTPSSKRKLSTCQDRCGILLSPEEGFHPDCCHVRNHKRSGYLIPILLIYQSSILDYVQVFAGFYKDSGSEYQSASDKSVVHKCSIIPSASFSP